MVNDYFIKQYETSDLSIWNTFVNVAHNGTFLFDRNFMEYHKDRFDDFSLLVFKNKKLCAILPANQKGDTIFSHQGLTFGGLLWQGNLGVAILEEIFVEIVSFCKKSDFKFLNYKKSPAFYAENQVDSLDYFLFREKAILVRRDMNLAVNYRKPFAIAKGKLKHYNNSFKKNLQLVEENTFDGFWNSVLIPRLQLRHNAKPVHNLEEITLLKSKFPENIKQFNVYHEQEIVAGITLFCSKNVVKSQYGATTDLGQELRALDFAFISLIEKYKNTVSFFDMGTVNEKDGSYNKGLLKQKEELGCETYSLDAYLLTL